MYPHYGYLDVITVGHIKAQWVGQVNGLDGQASLTSPNIYFIMIVVPIDGVTQPMGPVSSDQSQNSGSVMRHHT